MNLDEFKAYIQAQRQASAKEAFAIITPTINNKEMENK